MKTYTFFILSRSIPISVEAQNSYDAKIIIAHQLNIQDLKLIVQIGINLEDRHNATIKGE